MTNTTIADEAAMLAYGAKLAQQAKAGDVIYLKGELGAGKTTLTRGFLRAFGYAGIVKSPTYTLVETYTFEQQVIHHFDLYRLHSAEELLAIGLDDYVTADAILLFEWPEKAASVLPKPTLTCRIEIPATGDTRVISQQHGVAS